MPKMHFAILETDSKDSLSERRKNRRSESMFQL